VRDPGQRLARRHGGGGQLHEHGLLGTSRLGGGLLQHRGKAVQLGRAEARGRGQPLAQRELRAEVLRACGRHLDVVADDRVHPDAQRLDPGVPDLACLQALD